MEALSGMALAARVTVVLMGEQRHLLLIKHTAQQLSVCAGLKLFQRRTVKDTLYLKQQNDIHL